MEKRKKIYNHLYFWVIVAITCGIILGHYYPDFAVKTKPFGDAFIKLIKMMVAPIIFTTVVVGIANMGDMKKVGRIGVKALIYFEVVTTIALIIGLIVVKVYKPGVGINADVSTLNAKEVAVYAASAKSLNAVDFLLNIIPTTVVDAFAKGEILQVLLFSLLFGFALAAMGEKGKPLVKFLDDLSHALFGVINIIMKVAPVGAFGAMAFTIGKYGIHTLVSLGKLMAVVYTTCLLFIFIVLGTILKIHGFSIWQVLKYIKEEILIVLGTSSSESVLPRVMTKMEELGVSKSVVGLVIPTGYSFNLDGTSIYLTAAAIFIAQATNVHLSLSQELTILAILMLTSKGAAAVTGGGFVTLAATLSSLGGVIPVAGLALILGVDRFMSEARAITNLIGNAVATLVVAKWEREINEEKARLILSNGTKVENIEIPVEN